MNELKYSDNYKKINKDSLYSDNNSNAVNITFEMPSLKDNPYEESTASPSNVNDNNRWKDIRDNNNIFNPIPDDA